MLRILTSLLLLLEVQTCTDVLVTPEASLDGSSMIAYNADSGALMGLLYHYPPSSGKGGEERRIYEWDTGVSCIAPCTNSRASNKLILMHHGYDDRGTWETFER